MSLRSQKGKARFIALAGAVTVLLSASACRRDGDEVSYRPAAGPADPDINHVILISIDTLRADHLACYGHPFVETPNIDRLAAEGVLFEQHINAAPTTLNSHTSLMTGTYPHTHGTPRNSFIVHDKNVTLAEVLKRAGFTTAAFIGAFPLHSRFNFGQGFDTYDEQFEKMGMQVDQAQRRGNRVTNAVISWLDANEPEHMFLFIHYFDVHWPYAPPPPYDRMYRKDDLPLGGSMMEINIIRQALYADPTSMQAQCAVLDALYCGEVTYTDVQVGRLMDALRKRKLLDESLIILTSDHGEAMNEHWELWNHGHSTYETTIRTPLIIRQPGGKLGGTRHKHLVSNIDVMPTILDRLGLDCPQRVEGVSVAPLLAGGQSPARDAVFAEATKPWFPQFESDPVWRNARKCRTVRTDRWKFIYRPMENIHELYDLAADPKETHNLLEQPDDEARSRASELEEKLDAWTRSASPLPIEQDNSREALEKLRALGYVGGENR